MKLFIGWCAINLLAIILGVTFSSCEDNYPKYRYAIDHMVPDSLQDDKMKFITEGMRAADQHLTTSDYEDPEDVVSELSYVFDRTHHVAVEGVEVRAHLHDFWHFIPYSKLDSVQKQIFVTLKKKNANTQSF